MALAYNPLAFFMARYSLAEAIAAGVAGFRPGMVVGEGAGAAFCCAKAGAPTSARPKASAAADKLPERLFISILLKSAGVSAVQLREFPARRPARPCRRDQ